MVTETTNVTGRTCVSTAGSAGIGKATAAAPLGKGASVVIVARDGAQAMRNFGEAYLDTTAQIRDMLVPDFRQENDTISRLVYGLATAYLLTGEDRFLHAAESGTEYLREHMRGINEAEGIVYWYHGIDISGNTHRKIFTPEFGDDYDASRCTSRSTPSPGQPRPGGDFCRVDDESQIPA